MPTVYAVTALGTLGGSYSHAADLNNTGQVVGHATTSTGAPRAFIWNNGTMTDLGTLGGAFSYASGINDLGQVVGEATVPGSASSHAFLITPQDGKWFQDSDSDGRNDFMTDLGSLNDHPFSTAYDINDAGQVVGSSTDEEGFSYAFLWDANRGLTDLGTPTGSLYSHAKDINESGQVVILMEDAAYSCLWTPDVPNGNMGNYIDLGTLTGGVDTKAAAINDAGRVVGQSMVDELWWEGGGGNLIPYAFYWNGGMVNLGTLPSGINSGAADVNNVGQVVGSSTVEYSGVSDTWWYDRAFVWDFANGMVNPLDQLFPSSAASFLRFTSEQSAEAINDSGAILINGYGSSGFANVEGAYLLTPLPPGTPSISIADAPAVTEGNTGSRTASFTVTLSVASTQTITVEYITGNGDAAAGSDYVQSNGVLTFLPGQTSKVVTVSVTGDRLGEPNETFFVHLSNPTNAIITDGQGTGTIVDDEPRISINDVSKKEGNGKTTVYTFTISLSTVYDAPITVSYVTANGTALVSDNDYVATSGTLTFAPGETTKTVTVIVKADKKKELKETFTINLFDNSEYSLLGKSQGTGTILNDD